DVLRGLLTEDMRHLVAGLRSPLHGSGIGEEQHGTDDGVLEGTTVSVRVVRHRGVDAVLVGSVGDARVRWGVRSEWGYGQGETAHRGYEGFTHRIHPGLCVTTDVVFEEDAVLIVYSGMSAL